MKKVKAYKENTNSKDPLSYMGFLGKGVSGEEFVNRIRRSAREKRYVEKLRNR